VDATGASDESAWSRTVKPCGPDAPTLASSGDDACALRLRWWQESPVTRESAEEAVKTIAQGRPDRSGEPVATYSYAFHFRMRGCGCIGHPVFPAPSFFEGQGSCTTRARSASRECGGVFWSLKIEVATAHSVITRLQTSAVSRCLDHLEIAGQRSRYSDRWADRPHWLAQRDVGNN
jgi:hypothetical protein